jgi:hypothetical protein
VRASIPTLRTKGAEGHVDLFHREGPYERNARTHSKKQIRQIANSIDRSGFTNPVLISDDGQIIAGHGRVEAAKLLKIARVPTLRLSHLSDVERRAYILADNKLAQNAGWDRELLASNCKASSISISTSISPASVWRKSIWSSTTPERVHQTLLSGPEDELPAVGDLAFSVTRPGDMWLMGRHRLLCGDARFAEPLGVLLDNEEADLIFTDPIDGHVCGLGRIRHREFAMGVGEMSPDAFTGFLRQTLGHAAAHSRSGTIAFVCMDWRHLDADAQIDPISNQCHYPGMAWFRQRLGRGIVEDEDRFHRLCLSQSRVDRDANDICRIPTGDPDENPRDCPLCPSVSDSLGDVTRSIRWGRGRED